MSVKIKIIMAISLFFLSFISFGTFVPHPNQYFEGEYVVLAKDLDQENLKKLENELIGLWLSYEVSFDQKTVKITKKAKTYFDYDYKNRKITSVMTFWQKLSLELVMRSAALKSAYWRLHPFVEKTDITELN